MGHFAEFSPTRESACTIFGDWFASAISHRSTSLEIGGIGGFFKIIGPYKLKKCINGSGKSKSTYYLKMWGWKILVDN